MPRRLRSASGGFVYHVLNRAVGRACLFDKTGDYQAFEKVLRQADAFVPMRLLAYWKKKGSGVFFRKKKGLRQVSLGEEDEVALKPFDETLRVTKPAQESPTSTWKRVWRGGGVTHPAKRRQPASRPGD